MSNQRGARVSSGYLSGNHPLIVTPMHEDGTLDEESLRRLIDFVISGGANGLLALGTTGESFALLPEERRRAIRVTVEQTCGRVPVGIGAADTGTALVAEIASYAEEVGANYLLIPPPFYAPAAVNSEQGTLAFFREIAMKTTLPIMLYDGGCGIEIPLSTMDTLVRETETVRSVKLNMFAPKKVGPIQSLGLTAFCGTDLTSLLTLAEGADGFTIAVAGVVPEHCAVMWEAARVGDWERARGVFYSRILPIANVALAALPQFVPSFKLLLHELGVISSPRVRFPLLPLDPIRTRELQGAARQVGLI